ncbi:MerR family transcriptional regulator [Flavicella sp.]|uniref:MerR family transcriptional regulator n=1 Tax=Flavicella sp. TaxID=2957742 RepID=UPI0030169CD0
MNIDLPEKRYYKIGEVARAFGVNTSLIRFWEKEFEVIQPKKNSKGDRMFTPQDIENFRLIYHLVKEKGFTLDGAKKKLLFDPDVAKNNLEIIARLEFVKAELLKIKNVL